MTRLAGRACWSSAAVALIATASFARATTFYVRAAGGDGNDGLTPQTALARIRIAARMLRQSGDRLVVGPGTYHESNIAPRGSGSPDAPIVFFADRNGSLTDDPPGPVIIMPPNSQGAITGFAIYGRHDIYIEGFEIDGAEGAGFHVGPQGHTGIDSTGMTLVNNRVTDCHIGIRVTAVGDVVIRGDYLAGNSGTGLLLQGGIGGVLHPLVTANVIERNSTRGLRLNGSSGGELSANELRANGRDFYIGHTDALTIRANRILGPGGGGAISGADLNVTENRIEAHVLFTPTGGRLVLANNHFTGGGLSIGSVGAEALLSDNHITTMHAGGVVGLDLERNEIGMLEAKGIDTIIANDNRFDGWLKMVSARLEMTDNDTHNLVARASDVRIQNNRLAGSARIAADTGTIQNNSASSLFLFSSSRLHGKTPESPSGSFVIAGNSTDGFLHLQQGAARAVVEDNVAGGLLRVIGPGDLYVRRNDAHGIACILSASTSSLTLAENNSHDSAAGGLVVVGAGTATVQNNASSNNADSGLAVRRTKNAVIAGNDFLANAAGGISVLTPLVGDCNRDLRVTIDEIVTAVSVDLGQRPLTDCKAADVDGNGAVSIQEIVLAVADALDPPDLRDSAIALNANRVERNGRFGIDVFALGSVESADNHVVQNAGIPLAIYGGGAADRVQVVDNVLGLGGAQGLLLDGVARASVRNNVIFSNREAGILLRDAPGTAVVNNLVYANGDNGIAVGLVSPLPTVAAALANNTIYGNAGWGIAIGSAAAPSTGTVIHDNILQANVRGGIAASSRALFGLMLGFDLNDDRNGDGVSPADSDFSADPQFVAPAGADGILGGAGFADDDFHVQPTSPAIDAGSGLASAVGITGSAVAGQSVDEGIVDLGYHYDALP